MHGAGGMGNSINKIEDEKPEEGLGPLDRLLPNGSTAEKLAAFVALPAAQRKAVVDALPPDQKVTVPPRSSFPTPRSHRAHSP